MSEAKPDTDLVLAAPQRLQRSFTLLPETFGEAREMAALIAASDFAPKDYKGKPESVLIAIQMGADVGLRPMQSLQNIAVINGRPSIWGDGALALTMSLFERFEEKFDGEFPKDEFTAICTIRRRGMPTDTVQRFSIADAKRAGLWGKSGPWTNYPQRMLQMRCRSWALRDAAPDRLMGLILAEEAMDIEDSEPRVVGSAKASDAGEDGPEVKALLSLNEGLQERIEKGFTACALANGKRRALLKQFLLEPDKDLEEQALALLAWLEDEYAKRKTGQPVRRKPKGDGNGKETVASQPAGAVVAASAAPEPAADVVASAGTAAPAAPVKAQPDDSLF